jgi:hypothetical protein
MLRIDPSQLASLDEGAQRGFHKRLQAHLRKHFPDRFASLSDDEACKAVTALADHARALGLKSELAICLYLVVAVPFGRGFEAANIQWATPITPHPGERLDPDWIRRVVRVATRTLKRTTASPRMERS